MPLLRWKEIYFEEKITSDYHHCLSMCHHQKLCYAFPYGKQSPATTLRHWQICWCSVCSWLCFTLCPSSPDLSGSQFIQLQRTKRLVMFFESISLKHSFFPFLLHFPGNGISSQQSPSIFINQNTLLVYKKKLVFQRL